jgi:thiol-disulfide isomerase/thioredoxin
MRRLALGTAVLLAVVVVALYAQSDLAAPTLIDPAAPTRSIAAEGDYMSSLPDYGPAPELKNEVWLNTDKPMPLSSLRGKVVLLEMWTFECINCIHTLPSVRQWHDTYASQGFVVIGNHYPEFSSEANLDNLRAALVQLDIRYPVAQDNDRQTWDAYLNHYWPVMYLIDKQGHLRYQHIGEGAYDTTEANIVDLLGESYTPPTNALIALPQSISVASDVNVLSGAGVDQPQIGLIHPGEAFVVRGEQNGWYSINYGGQDGYVSRDLVSLSAAAVP